MNKLPENTDKVEDLSNLIKKRKFDEFETNEITTHQNKKLLKFQSELLEDNMDFVALKSSLSLLQSRLHAIKSDIKELNNFKRSIWDTDDTKSLHQLIANNSDYLKEINYKGSYVKCPSIQWNQNFGLDLSSLGDQTYETINEKYEIIKKDSLFK